MRLWPPEAVHVEPNSAWGTWFMCQLYLGTVHGESGLGRELGWLSLCALVFCYCFEPGIALK